MKTGTTTLVFIPTYNERENVEKLFSGILALGLELDVLFMDDNSPDGTGKILDDLAQKHRNLTVIHRSGKLGIGSAHREGIRWAYTQGYKILITMDSDFTHPPDMIPELLNGAEDYDVVVGSRYMLRNSLQGWNLYRKMLTHLGHFMTGFFLRLKYDATGALRLYRLDKIPSGAFDLVSSQGYSFLYESLFILNLNKFRIKEIPIRLFARTYGHSKMRFADAWQSLKLLMIIFVRTIVDRRRFEITETTKAGDRRMAHLFLISGILGFALGWLHAQWQWSVEVGQVLAGLVQYPDGNTFYVVAVKGWSLFNQLSALLLQTGMSEQLASYIISGICGMLAFQAVAVFMFALSESFAFALVSPVIIFFIHGPYSHGANYALGLLGSDNTYMMVSLSCFILIVGLIGAGLRRSGYFLLGLFPAIHPTQGTWGTVVVMAALLFDRSLLRDFMSRDYRFYLGGLAATLASLGVQLTLWPWPHPPAQTDLAPYYRAIVLYWTNHCSKFFLRGDGAMIRVYLCVILSAGALIYLREKLTRNVRFILVTFLVTTAFAGVFSTVYWFPLDKVQYYYVLLQLYPGRVFNYVNIGASMLVLGLLWRYRHEFYPKCTLAAFLLFMLLYRAPRIQDSAWPTGTTALTLTAAAIAGLWISFLPLPKPRMPGWAQGFLKFFTQGTIAVIVVLVCMNAWSVSRENRKDYFADYTNDAFYAAVHERPGMILNGPSAGHLDVKTRRAVLTNGGPSFLSYVPETAPETQRIYKNVYGVDFLNPPPDVVNIGRNLPPDIVWSVWAARTPQEWRAIGKEFQVTDIVVRNSWELQLPVIAKSDTLVLYEIPQ